MRPLLLLLALVLAPLAHADYYYSPLVSVTPGGPALPGSGISGDKYYLTTGDTGFYICGGNNAWTKVSSATAISMGSGAAWGTITGSIPAQTDLQVVLDAKLALAGNGSQLTNLTKTQVGLSAVENTALSTWVGSTNLTTFAAGSVTLANMASMSTASLLGRNTAGTGLPEVLTATTVRSILSIGNVDNTSDANKIISTATQTALNGKISTGGLAGSATALATGRTLGITGDIVWTSPAFDGTGNVTAVGTLATVASAGTTGSSTAIPVITINVKGLTTSITTAAVVAPAGTLTGATLAAGVTGSSLTSTGTLTGGATGAGFTLAVGTSTITGRLPFANGGETGTAATSATTGTMTVNMTTSIVTITPTGACTFNASGGVTGQLVTFSITTAGVSSFVLTWGTNFRKTGTLATGTVAARFYTVTFRCLDGTTWTEIARTIVQT